MMKLQKNANIAKFLIAVKACSGDVFFESSEGDVLNLASTLSQYVFCSVAAQPQIIEDGIVRCDVPEDYTALAEFLREA